jgi:ATP-dependent DNA helicase RecQ
MLLEYFGEKTSKNCDQCDICLDVQGKTITKDGQQNAREQICTLLTDHKRHHITEILRLPLPTEEIDSALSIMMQQEEIVQSDGFILLA